MVGQILLTSLIDGFHLLLDVVDFGLLLDQSLLSALCSRLQDKNEEE
jgi:hypothetical protein